MLRDNHMLDANAVLRLLLQDIEEQFQQVKAIVIMEYKFSSA